MAIKCPHCQNSAITLSRWGQGINAFRTKCQSCGIKLKATKGTYLAALVCLAVIIGLIVYLEPWAKAEGISRYTFKHGIIAGLGFIVCAAAYRFCGYDKSE